MIRVKHLEKTYHAQHEEVEGGARCVSHSTRFRGRILYASPDRAAAARQRDPCAVLPAWSDPESGTILLEAGRLCSPNDEAINVPRKKRSLGIGFSVLPPAWPHVRIRRTLHFPLRPGPVSVSPVPEVEPRVHTVLELVRLSGLEEHCNGGELSGGRQQRLALSSCAGVRDPKYWLTG